MIKELIKELKGIVESYINEVSDELIKKVENERLKKSEEDMDKYEKGENPSLESVHKFSKNQKLIKDRNKRIENFREKLARGFKNIKTSNKAKEEQNNAILNQGLRNKLEKSLAVSESCLLDIINLIEGDVIDFQKKRKEKILDRNAHKMADMIRSGELDGLRTTSSGELIGDPVALKKVKDIEKENKEVGLGRKVGM